MFITLYDYIYETQPYVIFVLRKRGLLSAEKQEEKREIDITYMEAVYLMRHDRWKKIGGVIRQIHPGRVVI